MTTYSNSLRLWEGVVGDPAIRNLWGTALNTNCNLIEAAILGGATVNVAGLTTYTLSTANGAVDQARPLLQQYTGALTGNCTVTLPNVVKYGWAQNSTTGSHNIILTAGAGTTATIPPDGRLYYYQADGGTNVTLPSVGFGALTTATAGTSGNQAINFAQFAAFAGSAGSIDLPGNVTLQWGNGTGPSTSVAFHKSFSSTPWVVLPVVAAVGSGGATGYAQVTTTVTSSHATIVTVSGASVGVTLQFYYLAIGPTA